MELVGDVPPAPLREVPRSRASQDVWQLTPEQFGECPLHVSPDRLQIVVCRGWGDRPGRQRALAASATPAAIEPAPVQAPPAATGTPPTCTYVSVDLGRVWIRTRTNQWMLTRWGHHVTLAYLPPMTSRGTESMRADLEEVLRDWMASRPQPGRRPLELLHLRQCHVRSRGDPRIWFRRALAIVPDYWVGDSDRVRMVTPLDVPTGDDETSMRMRLWQRDRRRIEDAIEEYGWQARDTIAVGQARWEPSVGVVLVGHYVVDCELTSLLSYLRDRLIHRHGVLHQCPRSEVGLHHAGTWHVTAQTDRTPDGAEHVLLDLTRNVKVCHWLEESSICLLAAV